MHKLKLLRERRMEEELCAKAPKARWLLDRLEEIYQDLKDNKKALSALQACHGVYDGSSLLAMGQSLHDYKYLHREGDVSGAQPVVSLQEAGEQAGRYTYPAQGGTYWRCAPKHVWDA